MTGLLGWWGVAGILFVESATGITPGIMLLGLAGWQLILAQNQPFVMVLAAGALAALASSVGSLVPYGTARLGGRPIIVRLFRRLRVDVSMLNRLDAKIQQRGAAAVLVGRCIPAIRFWLSIPAGLARMPACKYFLASLIGNFFWYTGWIAVGYGVGEGWPRVSDWALNRLPYLAGAAAVGLLLLWGYRYLRQRRLVLAPVVGSGD